MKRIVLALALSLGACSGADEPGPPPLRVALFAHMDEARVDEGPVEAVVAAERVHVALDFDADLPERYWFARVAGRRLAWDDDPSDEVMHAADGGLTGGALRIGPGVPEDTSRATFLVDAAGLARVHVEGRVRLEGHPAGEEIAAREVARVVEHADVPEEPSKVSPRRRFRSRHRLSRRVDPSGWDRFEVEFLTRSDTRSLEVELLHRSGDSDATSTSFDDVVVTVEPLSPSQVHDHVRDTHRPNDGREQATPWRLRVPLRAADGTTSETRDALLLAPPASIAFPVRLADPLANQQLRFHVGIASEAHGSASDGARLAVRFVDDADEVALGTTALDPVANEDDRRWREVVVDLSPVAGRTGELVFAALDAAEDTDGVDFDPLLLSTPRIEPAGAAPDGFNVLLIGIDTLRADHLSVFGYERATTPNLERLAAAGVRFPRARSQAPWTLPSFGSILTSLYPSTHGAGRGGHDEWTGIDPTTVSLAEILARVGYETQGIVANGLISPRYGLDQGFDAYRSAWAMESAERDSDTVAAWVESHTDTPWLLFWHVMDPHLPYSTDASFREEFTDADYDGQFARGRRGPSVPFQVLDPRPGRRWFVHEGPPPEPDMDDADRRFVSDYYDAEIAEMDAAVGQVLDALEASGQWERTIVAFIADHGEGLGDHDHYHHGYTLFEDQVHVPMLVRIPGRDEGRVVERSVAAIDLAPTILGALGIPVPTFFQGTDRLAPDAPADDAYILEYPTYDSSAQKAWVLGDFKYLHDPVFRTEALYHVGDDPGETNDVAAEHPELVARARAELDAFRWEQLQKGRYHLRVRGTKGARLELAIETDDLFDANFACRPQVDEDAFTLDLDRQHLTLTTELTSDRFELVFWGRGDALGVQVKLDGQALPLRPGDGDAVTGALMLAHRDVPELAGDDVAWPSGKSAVLWLEAGFAPRGGVVSTPEELEVLRRLGYAR